MKFIDNFIFRGTRTIGLNIFACLIILNFITFFNNANAQTSGHLNSNNTLGIGSQPRINLDQLTNKGPANIFPDNPPPFSGSMPVRPVLSFAPDEEKINLRALIIAQQKKIELLEARIKEIEKNTP